MARKPRKITASSLERIALYTIERTPTTTRKLRQALVRRIDRSLQEHEGDRGSLIALVDELIPRLQDAGYLNDALVAKNRAESMQRKGHGLRAIAYKLGNEGIARHHIDAALEVLTEEVPDADLVAASTWARKRGIGPWRTKDRADKRARDLAALARRGFSFDLAKRIIDAPTPDDVLDL